MGKQKIVIGEMLMGDVEEACALWYSTSDLQISPSFDTPDLIRSYLKRNPGFSTIARQGTKTIGAVMCGHDGRRGSFYHMAVVPEYRSQGIAKRIVDRSLSRLREIGINTAFLFTHEENLKAQGFWRAIGWRHSPYIQYRDIVF